MSRTFVILASLALLLFGAAMWVLGARARHELTTAATDQFNRQQLILAEKVSHDIQRHFQFLQTSLLELTHIWRRRPPRQSPQDHGFSTFQEILRPSDVLAIGLIPPGDTRPDLFDQDGPMTGQPGIDIRPAFNWSRRTGLQDDMYVSPALTPDSGGFAGRTVVILAARLWNDAPGAGDPGLLFFVVDALGVARRYAHDVRSGQTGYAWVLDSQGIFLDHIEEDFIGQDAFKARFGRDPTISFERINAIMRDRMLKGEQGVDWYVSGWHRGQAGEVRKLIAYTPVELAAGGVRSVRWSVAVVAPETEVQGIIGPSAKREFIMVAAFQAMVFMGLILTLYFAFRWSTTLRMEVEARTTELREARDKIRDNMRALIDTQERLIASERFAAIGEAAAHISHEIRNPLMLMGGFARQVRRVLDQEGEEARKLLLVEEEAGRLENMLGEVRDFTRPSAPRLTPGDLNATIWETAQLMEQDLAARGVVLRTKLDAALTHAPGVPHDPGQIRQVLINLLKNAAEAMHEGGAVTVTSRRNATMAEVEVRDTGPGLTPEQARQIFNPFFTTKERGTGLGLAVCYRIMADHHGDIRVTAAQGKGCLFVLRLPLTGPETEHPEARPGNKILESS